MEAKPFLNPRFTDNGEHSHWELLDSEGIIIWTEDTKNCFKDKHHPSYATPTTPERRVTDEEKSKSDILTELIITQLAYNMKIGKGGIFLADGFHEIVENYFKSQSPERGEGGWINSETRVPTKEDGDKHGRVLVYEPVLEDMTMATYLSVNVKIRDKYQYPKWQSLPDLPDNQ